MSLSVGPAGKGISRVMSLADGMSPVPLLGASRGHECERLFDNTY
jgi:hypothetical protein